MAMHAAPGMRTPLDPGISHTRKANMLTKDQAKKLEEAIKRATNPGLCRYVDDTGRPSCIIGQLAYLEGVPVAQLVKWDRKVAEAGVLEIIREEVPGTEKLAGYPLDVLERMQSKWDYGFDPSGKSYLPLSLNDLRARLINIAHDNVTA